MIKRIVIAVLTLATFVSCKKQWNCECDVSGVQVVSSTDKLTKKEAKAVCEEKSNGICEVH